MTQLQMRARSTSGYFPAIETKNTPTLLPNDFSLSKMRVDVTIEILEQEQKIMKFK
jgi:hypothetical protein